MRPERASTQFESRFRNFSWLTLSVNLAVILWGAYVRATGSGAGCGGHWPLCNGDAIPLSPSAETLIEYIHRISSGVALALTLVIVLWSRRYPAGERVRKAAIASGVFIIVEALLGAGLVLFDLVGGNTSAMRAAASAIHLSNTYFLLASLTLTAVWAKRDQNSYFPLTRRTWVSIVIALVGIIMVGASGAITALGDTLFPAGASNAGFADKLTPSAHFLIRLRVLHPLIALIVGSYLLFGLRLKWFGEREGPARLFSRLLMGLIALQWLAGAVNVLLLAPIWMQLVHLFIADLIWICFILYQERQLYGDSHRQPSV